MNLTTKISSLQFHPNSEILAVSSKWKKNGIRMINFSDFKVFQNFPKLQDSLKYPTAVSFSKLGNYMCVGNDEGNAYLYELNKFKKKQII